MAMRVAGKMAVVKVIVMTMIVVKVIVTTMTVMKMTVMKVVVAREGGACVVARFVSCIAISRSISRRLSSNRGASRRACSAVCSRGEGCAVRGGRDGGDEERQRSARVRAVREGVGTEGVGRDSEVGKGVKHPDRDDPPRKRANKKKG